MRLSFLYFCCFLVADQALGNVMAGPYQTMLLWYTYRMDSIANGGVTTIARDCKNCDFDQFLRFISKSGWSGSTSVGSNLHPDVDATAAELKSIGYDSDHAAWKLFPVGLPKDPAKTPGFKAVYQLVTDILQNARTKVGDAAFQNELDSSRTAITKTHAARLADQTNNMITELNKQIAASLQKQGKTVWTVDTQQVTGPDGNPYTTVDSKQTLANHPGESKDINKLVANFATNYNTMKGPPKSHYNAMQFSSVCETRIHGSPSC